MRLSSHYPLIFSHFCMQTLLISVFFLFFFFLISITPSLLLLSFLSPFLLFPVPLLYSTSLPIPRPSLPLFLLLLFLYSLFTYNISERKINGRTRDLHNTPNYISIFFPFLRLSFPLFIFRLSLFTYNNFRTRNTRQCGNKNAQKNKRSAQHNLMYWSSKRDSELWASRPRMGFMSNGVWGRGSRRAVSDVKILIDNGCDDGFSGCGL